MMTSSRHMAGSRVRTRPAETSSGVRMVIFLSPADFSPKAGRGARRESHHRLAVRARASDSFCGRPLALRRVFRESESL